MPKRSSKHIYLAIQEATTIMLVSHKNPDGDTLGSLTAMVQYLRQIEKPHVAFCATPISPSLQFLPHTEAVSQDITLWDNPAIDLVILFDCSSPDYAGVAHLLPILQERGARIVNIDHHPTNAGYGDLNLVLSRTSATTVIMHDFFVHNAIDITQDMATSLLTGIITDTGHFTNSGTTKHAMNIASKLIEKGGNLPLIQRHVVKDKTIRSLKLWGTVLSRMAHHAPLDIMYTYVTKQDLDEHKADEHETEGIANFLNTIKDGRIAMILKEKEDGGFKGSFRAIHEHADVSLLAKLFGGGGHKKAAGFSVDGPLDHALEHIFDTIHRFEKGALAGAEG